jgi:uncharacterized membrane protein YfcA
MNPITGLLTALGATTAVFIGGWSRAFMAAKRLAGAAPTPATDAQMPNGAMMGVGALTNFFDTLGIGSFAPTTSLFRFLKMVPDRVIPGTLNVGHTLPTVAEAFILVAVIPVDVTTLFGMIAASMLGAWLGAGVVSKWDKKKVQLGMGLCLLTAASIFTMQALDLFPGGGTALGVTGIFLGVAVAGNFALGALMTLGIGLYAPAMILVSLLGMDPRAAFPIMMGSCAFLMPVGSFRFIKEGSYSLRAALGLTIGGIPGVLLAAYIVKSLDLVYIRWLVIVVVLYTSITMLKSALTERADQTGGAA